MFMSPHDFQVIVRVTGEAAGRYGDFVAHFGSSGIYTFEPEPFALEELDPSGDGGPVRTSFGGRLFRGHFERGGSEIANDVSFEIEQVVHFRRFRSVAEAQELRYLGFGQSDAAFLAHLITGPPDFDQILNVQITSLGGVSDEDLRGGVVIGAPGRPNDFEARLQEGEVFSGVVQAESTGDSPPIELTIASEYYLETGDLAASM